MPTDAQWATADSFGAWNNNTDTYNSALKLPSAGNRNLLNGLLNNQGTRGDYWSSTVSGTYASSPRFGYIAYTGYDFRASGLSVRCLKN